MRSRLRLVPTAVLALGLPLSAAAPAYAGSTFAITVDDDELRLGDSFTVTGTGTCASSAYTVTLTYTDHDEQAATVTATGTTDASGEFTQAMTVPEAALPEEPASVQATADCGPTQTSNPVNLTIEYAEGTLTTDRATGVPGDVVEVSGTNCLGDDVIVVFTDGEGGDEVEVTLAADNTFFGEYVLPDAPGGEYFFAAECPGTLFADRAFVLVNADPGVEPDPDPDPTVPPAVPVLGPVNFTG